MMRPSYLALVVAALVGVTGAVVAPSGSVAPVIAQKPSSGAAAAGCDGPWWLGAVLDAEIAPPTRLRVDAEHGMGVPGDIRVWLAWEIAATPACYAVIRSNPGDAPADAATWISIDASAGPHARDTIPAWIPGRACYRVAAGGHGRRSFPSEEICLEVQTPGGSRPVVPDGDAFATFEDAARSLNFRPIMPVVPDGFALVRIEVLRATGDLQILLATYRDPRRATGLRLMLGPALPIVVAGGQGQSQMDRAETTVGDRPAQWARSASWQADPGVIVEMPALVLTWTTRERDAAGRPVNAALLSNGLTLEDLRAIAASLETDAERRASP